MAFMRDKFSLSNHLCISPGTKVARSNSFQYHVCLSSGIHVKVCKQAFYQIHPIGKCRVKHLCEKLVSGVLFSGDEHAPLFSLSSLFQPSSHGNTNAPGFSQWRGVGGGGAAEQEGGQSRHLTQCKMSLMQNTHSKVNCSHRNKVFLK